MRLHSLCALVVCLSLFCSLPAKGQGTSASEECKKDASTAPAKITDVQPTEVAEECRTDQKTSTPRKTSTPCTVLSKTLEVTVQNLCTYLADHTKPGSDKPKREDLVLFLDKRPLKEIETAPVRREKDESNAETATFRVELAPKPKNEDQRAEWAHVVLKAYKEKKPIIVSLGLPDSEPIRSEQNLSLMVPKWAWGAIGIMVVLAGGMLWLAWETALIRDGEKGPFSLAKFQMAWWFYLVISAWVCTAALMLSPTTITNSALVLMGISAATGLSAVAIDKNQQTEKDKAAPAAPEPAAPEPAAPEPVVAPAPVAAPAPAAAPAPVSQGFFHDLVTDRKGEMTVHRFQMLVWTLVLGSYFIYKVWNTMSLPEFDNNLLILMGISSGTYIGVKTQEK